MYVQYNRAYLVSGLLTVTTACDYAGMMHSLFAVSPVRENWDILEAEINEVRRFHTDCIPSSLWLQLSFVTL